MFERYTEKARRVIFFARYEASQFGSKLIETEHLLMGLLREDKTLANRFLHSHTAVDSIRKQVEDVTPVREKVSTSVDLPLSPASKRILAFGAEESERLGQKHIGPMHLLAGMLREEKCFAAEILAERGVMLSAVREELTHGPEEGTEPLSPAKEGTAKFKIPPAVLTEIARQAQTLGVDTHTHLLALIQRGLNSPQTQSELAAGKEKLKETYKQLRSRIAADGLPFLNDAEVDEEIARRKGRWRRP
jgi:ATP-dependent Clp protease ATP-binding subunit ClpC